MAGNAPRKHEGMQLSKLRGSVGWAWTVIGPFVGLVLIILLFGVMTRQSGRFLTVDNWPRSPSRP